MLKKIALLFTILPLSFQVGARGVDLKLANEIAEIVYLTESSTFGYGGADIGIGFMFTENDDVQFNGQIMISGNPAGNNKAYQFGVGGKIMLARIDINKEEIGAAAIGGQFRYVIPASAPVAFTASAYFAPGITSFSGADQYAEFSAAVELEVTPSARAYIGYRNAEYELKNGAEFQLDDNVHIGLKFEF